MIRFVNCFEVPVGREQEFCALWKEVNAYMVQKPGYVGHHLLRSLSGDARFQFVNVAEWASAEQVRSAHDEGFRALAMRPEFAPFTSTPAIYELVHSGEAQP